MKTHLWTVLAAAALVGATPGFTSVTDSDRPAKAQATVEFLEPESFTDFRISELGGDREQQELQAELRKEIKRLAAQQLPDGYQVMVRFRDIDMAGDFEPFRSGPWNDVRILRSIYMPRLHLEYAVTDAQGNVVAGGERKLIDSMYQTRVRTTLWSQTQIENELLADFFRDLRRELS